jgi:hypothetical protein
MQTACPQVGLFPLVRPAIVVVTTVSRVLYDVVRVVLTLVLTGMSMRGDQGS